MAQPKYFRPVGIRRKFGVIFDDKGNEVNEKERGLDEICDYADNSKHDWLLIPKEKRQKQYLYCLKCGLHSHF
jgi:hypothetical protein